MTTSGFEHASREIAAGRAKANALWTVLRDPAEREGFWLKPSPWEGSGEYQHVTFDGDRNVFVRIPFGLTLPATT